MVSDSDRWCQAAPGSARQCQVVPAGASRGVRQPHDILHDHNAPQRSAPTPISDGRAGPCPIVIDARLLPEAQVRGVHVDPESGWDGTYQGKPCDPGVYVYYFEALCIDNETYFQKGNITIIK